MSAALHGLLFEDPEVSRWFEPAAHVQFMLDVEAALADAEADAGLISPEHATSIREAARAERYSCEAIAAQAASAGNAVIPLVRELTAHVEEKSKDAAGDVHRGATSQDIIDTALVLQLKHAVPVVQSTLDRAAAAAAALARRHAETPMLGRTWLQQASPITFGIKAAGWMDATERARMRIAVALSRALVVQFGGATGTLASLGTHASAVSAALGKRLELDVPPLAWHTQRDRLVELACALGVACGTLGKIARDVALLAQGEVREASEAPVQGRGGSSSMPQKQNPVASAVAIAAAIRAPGLVSTMLSAMPQEHERGLGGWHAEWDVLPELVKITGGAARAMAHALESLVVNVDRMRENLEAANGLPFAEIVASALTERMGRAPAHARVENAARVSTREGRAFLDVLASDPDIVAHIDREKLDALVSPDRQAGTARALVHHVLAHWNRG
jgi:3-carboxy-cis,cis-muconate cycloisomerase